MRWSRRAPSCPSFFGVGGGGGVGCGGGAGREQPEIWSTFYFSSFFSKGNTEGASLRPPVFSVCALTVLPVLALVRL